MAGNRLDYIDVGEISKERAGLYFQRVRIVSRRKSLIAR
jgi:hypothetical protein